MIIKKKNFHAHLGIPLYSIFSTKETPFRLTYKTKVVIPIEIGELIEKTSHRNPGELNEEECREKLDLLEECGDCPS